MNDQVSLTPPEWYLMEVLWENSPLYGREIVSALEQRAGWSRSTTLTVLKRLTDKGCVACDDSGKINRFSPLIDRRLAVRRETDSFLDRVYRGSVGMMMSAVVKEQTLSRQEIDELYAILDEAAKRQGGE